MNIFINQNRIDDVIETHRMYNIQIIAGERKLSDIASKLRYQMMSLTKNIVKMVSIKIGLEI